MTPTGITPKPSARRRKGDRFVTVFVTVTLALFAALVGVIIYLVVSVSDTENVAHNATITACQLANENRAEDITIWRDVLGGSHPGYTAAHLARLAHDLVLVRQAYAPRNCTALYG
jgi:hypothetical protein